ncbi:pyridoxamine 5'-phosphate oxidase family protein [Anianabacter salinae]|uniref:pyridoxamine 5'-phosphate oxidase family protein n=1 Tax=Anianabacter salinae TaxID=2851023 RepID=UPI00225E49D2|nr:pyridoxamine 5'-phosphate oxidase family protein [Anianabacter salinae]MBV0910837.1 pyridoxamine 5'-phosphate oxidase family protein [Anianabacter salinae]
MPRPFDPETILHLPLMANLATVAADGSPRNGPVWFIWEAPALWMLGDASSSSVKRLAANPACAVEIVDYDNAGGILRHLGLRGSATVEPSDPARLRRLLTKYLGPQSTWNPWFIDTVARIDAPDGRMIRLEPESVFTNDVSYFRTGPELASGGDSESR